MATEAHGEAEAAVGMPQLDFSTWPNQIFWLLVTLVVIYFVLSKIALPRIAAVLADRKSTITNDLAAAEELKQKAVTAEKAYQDALTSARTEAAKIVAQAKAEIQKDLDAATAKADVEIAAKTAESEKSIAEIRDGACRCGDRSGQGRCCRTGRSARTRRGREDGRCGCHCTAERVRR